MSEELQIVFNLVIALAGAAGGWAMKLIYGQIGDLKQADIVLAERLDELPEKYARRDDMHDMVTRVERTLERIETKLDAKMDKAR